MPPRLPLTTVLVRILALSAGSLCVLLGGLFLVAGAVAPGLPPRTHLLDAVVTLGGAALCLVVLRPRLRPGWRTTLGLVLGGMAAAPATYWIRSWTICCEYVWVGSYGYPWRWGARALHTPDYPEHGDALLTGGGGLPLDVEPMGLVLDTIFWAYALLLCWLVVRAVVLKVRATHHRAS